MTPDEINQVYDSLAETLPAEAQAITQDIGAAEAAKGASLGQRIGVSQPEGFGIGAYNYNRLMAPRVASLADSLVVQGRQEAFKAGVEQAIKEAQEQYNNAKTEYGKRQAARRAAAAAAAARRASGGGGGGGGGVAAGSPGSTIQGVDVKGNAGGKLPDDVVLFNDGGYYTPERSQASQAYIDSIPTTVSGNTRWQNIWGTLQAIGERGKAATDAKRAALLGPPKTGGSGGW